MGRVLALDETQQGPCSGGHPLDVAQPYEVPDVEPHVQLRSLQLAPHQLPL
eukprot:CAMPEP_0206147586 /NCGR_PEP_ID=MMETSP1473-20131121/33883_1 /ASSEMBLY_ACC=CAM_ASM_001109 /TAXON_ID=1461547 /ORGANISM="Stichococcus sp, Strain RCC1054" /LENGTH=50 /DNA_ID=CAMNT_0053544575 /DNA_START=348 /DNA_END=497 /DNA_ORIENTATION=-